MTAPGDLRERLVLEEPVETPDGAGGVIRSFAAVATLWAFLAPLSSRGEIVADAQGATAAHRIVIRMRSDVTTRHRLRLGSRVFRILALRELPRRYLEITAEERME